MDDKIDPAAGVYLLKKVGDRVKRGDVLCKVHWNDTRRLHATMSLLGRLLKSPAGRKVAFDSTGP